ncbi:MULTISPECIES: helix-turn-helix domain-containing protein [unclassified Nonomuraea]|uniref:helix-turn-helix domain-containing protein n=1 Tax=Nonomuraea sp. NPDC049725 TaxID=3154508 RepID=UPI00343AAECF
MAAESAQTLERGLRLLRLLADGKGGRTPTELSAELSLSRPVVYRLLTTLLNEGFVRRDAEGRVHLGFGVLVLAQAVQPLLRAAALPTLRRLAEQVGATAHLTVAEGDDGLAVAVVEPSWTDMHVAYREGSRHPLAKGAAGQAILAAREGRADYLVTEGQLQEGARGMAAPVTGLPWLEASVGVVTFGPLPPSTGAQVVEAAAGLADALG